MWRISLEGEWQLKSTTGPLIRNALAEVSQGVLTTQLQS